MRSITYLTTLLVTVQVTISIPAKNNARPVIEVVNEQARIDDKSRPGFPYVNPLAGNSKQNAKIHAQNQQAMFNAERVRQQRAQFQRWTKAPQQEDSYMKAYHESQENHQLALEQQQAKVRDNKAVTIAPKLRQAPRRVPRPKTDATKITKADAVVKKDRIRSREERTGVRNHRSYGSVDYHQHLQPKRYQTVYVSPGPTYDQGVTIKPNGNVGLATLTNSQANEETRLYTEAIPSKTQYVYPKQYSQMQSYQSAYDIDTLNSLLKKNPSEQLTELNALLGHESSESEKDTLNTPVDLYFYLKDNPAAMLPGSYDQHQYAQIKQAQNYASAFAHATKDHTPITEEIEDDVEDPNKIRPKPFPVESILAAQAPEEPVDSTTTKNNNYYKVEVASQVISAPYNPKASYYYKSEHKPSYEALHYKPYHGHDKEHLEGDLSERYLHHNAQVKGIQHLSEDGTGVSAYGDENVSIKCNDSDNYPCFKVRKPRSALETDPFLVPNNVKPLTEAPIMKAQNTNDTTPKADQLIRFNYFGKRKNGLSTFLTTPNFPIGVANDYLGVDAEYEEYSPRYTFQRPNRYNPAKYDSNYDDEEEEEYADDEYDSSDYDNRQLDNRPYGNRFNQGFKRPSLYKNRPFHNYAPGSSYSQNDQKGSFTNNFRQFNRPNFNNFNQDFNQNYNSGFDYPQYSSQNGYGAQDSYSIPDVQNFGEPPVYGPPKPAAPPIYGPPKPATPPIVPIRYGTPVQSQNNVIEPIYMLTQSQLKDLIGDHNLNIQHYDIFQLPKTKKKQKPVHYPRKHKKGNRWSSGNRHRNIKKHIGRLHKLHYAANYEFGYRVRDYHSGNDFGHHEAKEGEKTNGHYHVLLPDGRMQKVKYSAGPEGFHADISYDHLH